MYLAKRVLRRLLWSLTVRNSRSNSPKGFPNFSCDYVIIQPDKNIEAFMSIRKPSQRRNQNLERLLRETNSLLEVAEERVATRDTCPEFPVILIMGAPRSGSTLFMQWLANTGLVDYPTNILSRFFGAPAIGARIQKILTDPEFSFRDDLFDIQRDIGYESNLGKTSGALSPNEFWYFWRRFFPLEIPEPLTAGQLANVDIKTFLSELAALTDFYQKPFAMKGMLLNFNIDFLAKQSTGFIFVHLIRDTLFNAQSLLQARLDYFGNIKEWYSSKPPEYKWLKKMDPFHQVVGQCIFTNYSIRESLLRLPPNRAISVGYESFCCNPKQVYDQLVEALHEHDAGVFSKYTGPEKFSSRNDVSLPAGEFSRLKDVHNAFMSGEVPAE